MRSTSVLIGMLLGGMASVGCGDALPSPGTPVAPAQPVIEVASTAPAPTCEVVADVLKPNPGQAKASGADFPRTRRQACGQACEALPAACADGEPLMPQIAVSQQVAADGSRQHEVTCRAFQVDRHVSARATTCVGAYEELLRRGPAHVQTVHGLGGQDVSRGWDEPTQPGDVRCHAEVLAVARRAVGRAEGDRDEGLEAKARAAACAQLGLTGKACKDAPRSRSTARLQIIGGVTHAEREVELYVQEEGLGEGRGATKLDACHAAAADACTRISCIERPISLRAIDGVSLQPPSGWPTRGRTALAPGSGGLLERPKP